MNKELLELLDSINEKKALVRSLAAEGKVDEAKAAKEEMIAMQGKFDVLKDLDIDTPAPKNAKLAKPTLENDEVKEFINAARGRFSNVTIREGSDPDGGYLVPEDVRTKAEKYRDAKFNLSQLVTVEPTKYESGQRTYFDKAHCSGFTETGEGEDISEVDAFKLLRTNYQIKKFTGYTSASNEILADSDNNIEKYIYEWLGDGSRVTRNKKILSTLTTGKESTYKTIKTIDDISKIVNVDLGSVYAGTSCIITNDYGKYEMSLWKDANGRSLLQPLPNEKGAYQLYFGSVLIDIKVLPVNDMPNVVDTGKTYAPIFIGDFKEALILYDRKKVSISASKEASIGNKSAFATDSCFFKATERFDCQIKDKDAYIMAHFSNEIK